MENYRTSIKTVADKVVLYSYDDNGDLETVTASDKVVSLTRDESGEVVRIEKDFGDKLVVKTIVRGEGGRIESTTESIEFK